MLAYYFHWSEQDILDLEHRERVRYIEKLSALRGVTTQAQAYNF